MDVYDAYDVYDVYDVHDVHDVRDAYDSDDVLEHELLQQDTQQDALTDLRQLLPRIKQRELKTNLPYILY